MSTDSQRRYTPRVLLHNWFEDRQWNEANRGADRPFRTTTSGRHSLSGLHDDFWHKRASLREAKELRNRRLSLPEQTTTLGVGAERDWLVSHAHETYTPPARHAYSQREHGYVKAPVSASEPVRHRPCTVSSFDRLPPPSDCYSYKNGATGFYGTATRYAYEAYRPDTSGSWKKTQTRFNTIGESWKGHGGV